MSFFVDTPDFVFSDPSDVHSRTVAVSLLMLGRFSTEAHVCAAVDGAVGFLVIMSIEVAEYVRLPMTH